MAENKLNESVDDTTKHWEVRYGNSEEDNVKFFDTKEEAQKFVDSWANFDHHITKMQGPNFVRTNKE